MTDSIRRDKMRKIIFFDIDGTLVDSMNGITDISPKVKEAIYRLKDEGHYVFIATGRPYAFLSEALLNFGFDGFILANGAQIILEDKIIFRDKIDKRFVEKAIQTFEDLAIEYILEDEYYSYLKEEYEGLYSFYESIGISRKLIKREYQIEDIEVQKMEMCCETEEAMQKCLDFIQAHPEYDYWHSVSAKAFEVYPRRNTKATAILKVLEHLDIALENSFAFGDGKNDIEMLGTVGCGIAMGNASDEVKQYAHVTTETVHNDGVAIGIEKYIFNN